MENGKVLYFRLRMDRQKLTRSQRFFYPECFSMSTRYIFLSFFFFLLFIDSSAQSRKDRFAKETFNTARFKEYEVKFNVKKSDRIDVHFASIIVEDKRADTSKIGFMRPGTDKPNYRFTLPDQDDKYLQQKILQLIAGSGGSDTLLLSLKTLWLHQVNVQASGLKSIVLSNENQLSHCNIYADIYLLKQNQRIPLGIIDTALFKRGWIANNADEILKRVLEYTVKSCDDLYQNPQKDLPVKTQQVEELRFPILQTTTPKKGIYFTYQNFLDNDPDTSFFTVEMKSESRLLRSPVKSNLLLDKCWGYCDETGLYINIDKDFYKLNKSNNTFDVWGPASVEVRNTLAGKIIYTAISYPIFKPYVDLSSFLEPSRATRNYMKFYQLDIRSGILK